MTGAWSRTWAPVGQRPVLHVVRGRPVKMSMAAVCCYRRGHVSRMLFRTRPGWYRDRDLVAFVDGVHRVLGAPVILVWGNLAAHRSGRMRAAIEARKWLEVEYLPCCAPELNPVE
ncbi:transposase [Thermobifida halotolerans]|uniref:transposase n=1 Tax=Thermobifida halotolerans TaxID=483545 RepID=UPI001F167324|nr:transposase [Thermobifida halotolerans]